MSEPLATEIQNMTDEEIATLNKKLSKRLLKRTALTVAAGLGTIVAIDAVVRQLDTRRNKTDN